VKQQDITDKELAEIARKKREEIENYRRKRGDPRPLKETLAGIARERKGNRGKGTGKGKGKTTRARKPYLFYKTPKWLLYSGLPRALNEKYGMRAWAIFERLIMLDCRFNPGYPDWFDQGYEELGSLTGFSRQVISRYIRKFEKAKLIKLVRGKFTGSKSRFKINNFMTTPINPNKIRYTKGGLLGSKGKRPYLRYYESVSR